MASKDIVLVVGSTGYIGTRLVDALLNNGYTVRAGFRNSEKLEKKPWSSHPNLIPVKLDVFDIESLVAASSGCMAAYYLVHSMYGKGDFAALDRKAAHNLSKAAEKAGLRRIIYLGGLGDADTHLSKHLYSRLEVSRILHEGSVPATTLRAAMIVGAGSASFEIMRYLVDRLPAMVTPKWVRTKSQPIAVSNVIRYLVGCLESEDTAGGVFDIGGPDVLSYQDLMRIYTKVAGLTRRFIVPIPMLTPRLSSYWLSLVTPLPTVLARPLIEGLRSEAVCQNDDIQSLVPQKLLSVRQAIHLALEQDRHKRVYAKDTLHIGHGIYEWVYDGDPDWAGGSSFWITKKSTTSAERRGIWSAIKSVLGTKGWNYGSWVWPLRGYLDVLLGGNGMIASPRRPKIGSKVDCWEVVELVPERRLRLRSTLKMPAAVVLTVSIKSNANGSELELMLHYHPVGFAGLIAWYGLLPVRRRMISKLLDRITQIAEA